MKISVIIPVYNGSDVIARCLSSVLSSKTGFEIEIIAIDDGSEDPSAELIGTKFPQINLFANERNRGYAYSVNHGIKKSAGDLVFLLNQDTELEKDALDLLARRMLDADSKVAAVAPQLRNFDGTIQKSVRRFPTHTDVFSHHLGLAQAFPENTNFNRWKMPDFDHQHEAEVPQPAFSAIMIRREITYEIGLLDTGYPLYFNDVDYCRRIYNAGYRILFLPDAVVRHQRGQATSQRKAMSVYLSHSAFIRYLQKNYRGTKYLIPNFICAILLVGSAHVRALYHLLRRPFI